MLCPTSHLAADFEFHERHEPRSECIQESGFQKAAIQILRIIPPMTERYAGAILEARSDSQSNKYFRLMVHWRESLRQLAARCSDLIEATLRKATL
jgi:hypothetical protein